MNTVSVFKIADFECISFNNFDYWEGVDEVLIILDTYFKVFIIEELEGPDTRIVNLNIEERAYILQYNSYGTILKPKTYEAVLFMKDTILNKFSENVNT